MQCKSVFISDVHLGTKSCKAKRLHDFLSSIEAENLYLVGDIIDGWALKRQHYWTKGQTEVLRKILKLSEKMNVYFLPGNHDEFVRPFFKFDFQVGDIQVLDSVDYDAIDGRRIYICHGDRFDLTMKIPRQVINFFAHFGEGSWTDKMYRYLGTEKVIDKFITAKGYDCAITGHTHDPMIKDRYMNCGDWVTNCTALVEHLDGTWQIIKHEKNPQSS